MTAAWIVPLWLAFMLAVALWIVCAIGRQAMEEGEGEW